MQGQARRKSFVAAWTVSSTIAVLVALTGCGRPATPPPAPIPPAGPGTAQVMGAYLEQASAGNILDPQADNRNTFAVMGNALAGVASVNINKETRLDYIVEYAQNGAALKKLSEAPSTPMQMGSLKYQAGSDMRIYLSSAQGSRAYPFNFRIAVSGVMLSSTDQVALFGTDSRDFLRIAFRSNPIVVQRFQIGNMGTQMPPQMQQQVYNPWATQQSYFQPNYSAQFLNVIQQSLSAAFTYKPPTQQQTQPQPTSPTQPALPSGPTAPYQPYPNQNDYY